MTPAIEQYQLITILYWALMLPISAYILHAVASYCTDDAPTTFGRAIFLVLVTAVVVFLAFDLSAYFFVLLMRDPTAGIVLPAGFTYWDWMREPLSLKWNVLGLMPFIRYLPVFFALIVGCIVQIFMWKVDFKLGAVVFIAQVFLNLVAMFALSFVFRFAIAQYERSFPPPEARPAENRRAEPTNLQELGRRAERHKQDASTIWRQIEVDWDMFNEHLQPMYRVLQPVTDHLPRPAQDFLNAGGWVLVFTGMLGLVVFWPRIHRNRKEYLKPRKNRAHAQQIKLAEIGDSVSGLGPRQATVNGSPARLRLVVIAGNAAADKLPELLGTIRPDLAGATASDYPRFESWRDPGAHSNFRKAVETRVELPAQAGQPSDWSILIGRVPWAGSPVPVALGFLVGTPSAVRLVDVADGQWSDAIGIRDVPIEERE